MRRVLRKILIECWQDLVENEYAQRRVNSERSLQAAYWAKLNQALPAKNYRIFVEPLLHPRIDARPLFPDLVICNSQRVVSVIELKYQPRAKPSYQKDIRTLVSLAIAGSVTLSNERFAGPGMDARSYELTKRVLYVWAGIHKETAEDAIGASPIQTAPQLAGRFLCLRAVTSNEAMPVVRVE